MFDAVDAGDAGLMNTLEEAEVQPAFQRMARLTEDATMLHTSEVAVAVSGLRDVETLMHAVLTIGFGIGFSVALVLGMIVRRYQRRLLDQAEGSRHQATHDALTGLPNRTLFTDRVGQALSEGRRTGTPAAVMLLDLDRFKEVNDTLGHHYGDELLRQVAARLLARCCATPTPSPGCPATSSRCCCRAPNRRRRRAGRPGRCRTALDSFVLGDVTVDIEISIGIAVAPEHADDASRTLLRCADLAMYAAKDAKTGVVGVRPGGTMHTSRAGCCCSANCAGRWSSRTS